MRFFFKATWTRESSKRWQLLVAFGAWKDGKERQKRSYTSEKKPSNSTRELSELGVSIDILVVVHAEGIAFVVVIWINGRRVAFTVANVVENLLWLTRHAVQRRSVH